MADIQDIGGPYVWDPIRPVVRFSPDLGWSNIDNMLDPDQNGLAFSVSVSDMSLSSSSPRGYISRAFRAIDVVGTNYDIPAAYVYSMIGNGVYYYYQYYTSEPQGNPTRIKLLLSASS